MYIIVIIIIIIVFIIIIIIIIVIIVIIKHLKYSSWLFSFTIIVNNQSRNTINDLFRAGLAVDENAEYPAKGIQRVT